MLPLKIAHWSVLTISFSLKEITNPSSEAQLVCVEKSKIIKEKNLLFLTIVSCGHQLYGQ